MFFGSKVGYLKDDLKAFCRLSELFKMTDPCRPLDFCFISRLPVRWSYLAYLIVFGLVLPSARAAESTRAEPLEPEVAEASDEPRHAMAGIRIPEGWEISLFAAEPDVANVAAFDIDHRGRLFVCETFRQSRGVTDNRAHDETWLLADLAATTVQDRIDYHKRLLGEAAVTYAQHDDRIRRLVDSSGDGRADQSAVVADGFNRLEEGTGAGVLVRGENIYYTCIPNLWKLVDADDDGGAEEREKLSGGYGVRVAFRGHDLHGLLLGPDGRLYFTVGDRGYHVTDDSGQVLANPATGAVFRCELDGSGLEVYCNGLRNPQELAFNDFGDLFTVDNNSDSGDQSRIVHLLEGGDSGWRMHYQYLPDRGPFNREKLWEPFHQDQPAHIVPPVANLTDGPSGLAYYPGTGFAETLDETFLICDFRGGASNSGIRSFQLDPAGAFYSLREDEQPVWSVLATDVAFGPDGAIYISDWVNGWEGEGKGRIYRLTDPAGQQDPLVGEVQSLLAADWSQQRPRELVKLLGHRDRRVRLEAQWELASRGEAAVLLELALDRSAPRTGRLHAIWGADQIARRDDAAGESIVAPLRAVLDDDDPILRAAAAKVAGERGDAEAAGRLQEMLRDEAARVRYFAALSLGKLKFASAFDAVVAMIAENANQDPAIRHAGAMYLALAAKPARVAKLANHPEESVRRTAVVALRRRSSGHVADFLADASQRVQADAARAIHDTPIPVAAETLAAKVGEPNPDADPTMLHRALNANYRLATAEGAQALARFAADVGAPEELRMEALEMLAEWKQPDPRDRVTNAYAPQRPREAKLAAKALSPHIDQMMTSQESVREKAIQIASTLGIKKITPLLVKRVANERQRTRLRAAALRALARLEVDQAVAAAHEVPLEPASELLQAAIQVLRRHDATGSVPTFVKATESGSVAVRQAAWDALAAINHPVAVATIESAVQDYLDGTLAAEVELNVLEAARGRIDPKLADAVENHQAQLAADDPLGPWLQSLHGGNATTGRKLFFEKTKLSCVRCHQLGPAGGKVGPDLSTIADTRDRRYLLESICLPDAKIAEGYETALVADEDGQVFTGIVQTDDEQHIELLQADGSLVRISKDEITARKQGQSSMPADLVRHMTARELRDLVACMASLHADESNANTGE